MRRSFRSGWGCATSKTFPKSTASRARYLSGTSGNDRTGPGSVSDTLKVRTQRSGSDPPCFCHQDIIAGRYRQKLAKKFSGLTGPGGHNRRLRVKFHPIGAVPVLGRGAHNRGIRLELQFAVDGPDAGPVDHCVCTPVLVSNDRSSRWQRGTWCLLFDRSAARQSKRSGRRVLILFHSADHSFFPRRSTAGADVR